MAARSDAIAGRRGTAIVSSLHLRFSWVAAVAARRLFSSSARAAPEPSHRTPAMLYADKAALENRTKLRLIAIRERELELYTRNCRTVGTVTALMSGIAFSSIIYTKMAYFQTAGWVWQALYLVGNTSTMCLGLQAVAGTTILTMLGPGRALRGPDGSMHETVDGLAAEFVQVSAIFHRSVNFFLFTVLVHAWGPLARHWLASCVLTAVVWYTYRTVRERSNLAHNDFARTETISGAFFHETHLDPHGATVASASETAARLLGSSYAGSGSARTPSSSTKSGCSRRAARAPMRRSSAAARATPASRTCPAAAPAAAASPC